MVADPGLSRPDLLLRVEQGRALREQVAELAEAVAQVELEVARVHEDIAAQGGSLAAQAAEHARRAREFAAREQAEAERLRRAVAGRGSLRVSVMLRVPGSSVAGQCPGDAKQRW
jgi:hypothetical protein